MFQYLALFIENSLYYSFFQYRKLSNQKSSVFSWSTIFFCYKLWPNQLNEPAALFCDLR